MRRRIFIAMIALLLAGCGDKDLPRQAPVKPVTDNYYGIEVRDPYRYMENMDDTVFLGWMKEYADYSREVLDQIPGRDKLMEQFRSFDARGKEKVYALQITENGNYFYLKMTPDNEKGRLFYREHLAADEVLLYDPEDFDSDSQDNYSIAYISPDNGGKIVGVSLAPNGSESLTMIFIDVATGKLFKDTLNRVFGSFSWTDEGKGVIYGRTNSDDIHNPDRLLFTKVYYHEMGSPQASDQVVFSDELYPQVNLSPEEMPVVQYNYTQDEFYLVIGSGPYIKAYCNTAPVAPGAYDFRWQLMFDYEDQVQNFYILNDTLYLYTAKNTANFHIIKTSKTNPDIPNAVEVVSEPESGLISGFAFTNEALYYKVREYGVQEKLYVIPGYSGDAREIELPVSAGYLSIQTRGHLHDDIWVIITGWTMDGKRYRYHAENNEFTEEQLSSTGDYPEFKDLVVEEIMVPSHDGVMVPLSLIYKKGVREEGPVPVIISGYGSYGKSRIPYFSPFTLTWTLYDGIYAVAHVRGGGELGDAWRIGGQKENKPNTWKDFIACTEYLVERKYTTSDQLAMYGGSAAGILIGRAMTERPDLFAAAIPMAGVMNTLRLEESPNGPANAPEFGTVKDSAECMALIEMDAYLHIEDDVKYPATLITAGFNDPRVIVWQPAKFAARIQAANSSGNPILLEVDYSSGHGLGNTKSQSFQDVTDLLSFALWNTGHPEFQPE